MIPATGDSSTDQFFTRRQNAIQLFLLLDKATDGHNAELHSAIYHAADSGQLTVVVADMPTHAIVSDPGRGER